MKIQTLCLLASTIAALGAVTAAGAKPAPATPQAIDIADGAFVTRSQFSETSGEAMYRRVCAACHMANAEGAEGAGFYPALTNNPKLEAGAYPLLVIMQGMNGMPALGGLMTDQQAADVVNYIRTHFGNHYKDAVTAEDAKASR